MSELHDMISRWAQPGTVTWIGVRPARAADIQVVDWAEILDSGLSGDRGRAGKRAVTLVQAEHLPAITSYLGRDQIDPGLLRRNIVVRGLNLAGLKGREVQVGTAVLRFTTICAPCSRMERVLGHGGYAAMRAHGGWCAEVVKPGTVALGNHVRPID
ncbi:molybdenum cofactor sulfurase [Tateyamaria omphalii]|uniref:MOSC domain-containing protein n=1 Tax=Tateyamaria omphalii TaxID=299262 RepID=UPI00199672E6|nr:MOSC domain-containing protein [Tateyamaria omphalii]GGX58650.1 molybdenum cofactor sulfurase [Tateyamaria omphalii]